MEFKFLSENEIKNWDFIKLLTDYEILCRLKDLSFFDFPPDGDIDHYNELYVSHMVNEMILRKEQHRVI